MAAAREPRCWFHVAAVADFLIELGCGPVIVVGHSLGGSIALALAAHGRPWCEASC